jgi:hypothetical protein
MSMRVHRSMIHVAVAEAAVLLTSLGYANILNTTAPITSAPGLPAASGPRAIESWGAASEWRSRSGTD